MRDRLVELLGKELMDYASWQTEMALAGNYDMPSVEEVIADKIIKDGWFRPPCKVGDIVYIDNGCILPEYINGYARYSTCEVISIVQTRKQKLLKIAPINAQAKCSRYNLRVPFSAIDKTVFLTKEEAEEVLKERE